MSGVFMRFAPVGRTFWRIFMKRNLDPTILWYDFDMDYPTSWILKYMPMIIRVWRWFKLCWSVLGFFSDRMFRWFVHDYKDLLLIGRIPKWFSPSHKCSEEVCPYQIFVEISSMLSIDLQVKLFLLKSNSNVTLMHVLKSKILTNKRYVMFNGWVRMEMWKCNTKMWLTMI